MSTVSHIYDADRDRDLEHLCLLFEEELTRQEEVYEACCAQGEAACIHDVPALEDHTARLVTLMEESFEAEKQRLPVLERMVSVYQLPAENHTLSDLIAAVPHFWRVRLTDFQCGIKDVLAKTQQEVRSNRAYMLQASSQMQDVLTASLQQDEKTAETYSHDGSEVIQPGQRPAVLNALG